MVMHLQAQRRCVCVCVDRRTHLMINGQTENLFIRANSETAKIFEFLFLFYLCLIKGFLNNRPQHAIQYHDRITLLLLLFLFFFLSSVIRFCDSISAAMKLTKIGLFSNFFLVRLFILLFFFPSSFVVCESQSLWRCQLFRCLTYVWFRALVFSISCIC